MEIREGSLRFDRIEAYRAARRIDDPCRIELGATDMTAHEPSELTIEQTFALNGYVMLKGILSADELAAGKALFANLASFENKDQRFAQRATYHSFTQSCWSLSKLGRNP